MTPPSFSPPSSAAAVSGLHRRHLRTRRFLALVTFGCGFALLSGAGVPTSVSASGSYSARAPQPRIGKDALDREKYALGQRIVGKKVELPPAQSSGGDQVARLTELQAMLPQRVARKTNLAEFAGRLTLEQFAAVDYYVRQRYAK